MLPTECSWTTRCGLLALLVFAVATVWVQARWATCALEAGSFLGAAALALKISADGRPVRGSWLPLAFLGMAAWALVQQWAGWTEVRAETTDAALYWLTASCLAWIGYRVCLGSTDRRWFLHAYLFAGSTVALVGMLQLYTSGGKIFWLFPSGFDTLVIGPFVSPNNYAAFVELLVPLALVLGLKSRQPGPYLVLAAALVAAVIAGGSRAGALLVICESGVVFLMHRTRAAARPRVIATFLVTAVAFSAVVGYQFLLKRLTTSGDLLLVRREFLESSIAMFLSQPMHGFGLGTWPSVYPRFAVVDIGAVANHAHNEWVQWAAEGGIPALLIMLALAAGVLRPAIRTGWGIGLLAVLIHSLVDYPFLRLGLASWIFALVGALAASDPEASPPRRQAERRLRVLLVAASVLLGIAAALPARAGWADCLWRRGTAEDLRQAIRLNPGRAEYQASLADRDPRETVPRLRRAIELNPGLTSARLRLAWELEAVGDLTGAEHSVMEATRYDRQFLPAWTAANWYFRRGRKDEFWHWARVSAELAYDDLGGLFNLCFRVTSDANEVLARVVGTKRSVQRSYLAFLTGAQRLDDAALIAARIAARPMAEDREALLAYVEAAHNAGHGAAALDAWESMRRAGLLQGGHASDLLFNGAFRQPLTGRGLDWRVLPTPGVQIAQTNGRESGVRISFSGQQREHCELLAHRLVFAGGASYIMRFRYRTSDLPASSGVYWSLGEGRDFHLDASEEWRPAVWSFRAAREAEQLLLLYRRAEGTARGEGWLMLGEITLERLAGRPGQDL